MFWVKFTHSSVYEWMHSQAMPTRCQLNGCTMARCTELCQALNKEETVFEGSFFNFLIESLLLQRFFLFCRQVLLEVICKTSSTLDHERKHQVSLASPRLYGRNRPTPSWKNTARRLVHTFLLLPCTLVTTISQACHSKRFVVLLSSVL